MEPFEIAIILLGLAGGAIAKGATGMGLPLVAIPALAPFLGLPHAISIMVVPILVTNIWQVRTYREAARRPEMRFLVPMLIAAGVGVLGGTWFLATAPERVLSLSLGIMLLAYLALRLLKPSFRVGPANAWRWASPIGLGAGLLHGATGISAPLGVTFIHAMQFDRNGHVFAVSATFIVLGSVQLPALLASGVVEPIWLAQGALALIPVLALMPVGQFLASKLSRQAFDRMILAFLGLIGLKLALGL